MLMLLLRRDHLKSWLAAKGKDDRYSHGEALLEDRDTSWDL